jgi:hypothetical protein
VKLKVGNHSLEFVHLLRSIRASDLLGDGCSQDLLLFSAEADLCILQVVVSGRPLEFGGAVWALSDLRCLSASGSLTLGLALFGWCKDSVSLNAYLQGELLLNSHLNELRCLSELALRISIDIVRLLLRL